MDEFSQISETVVPIILQYGLKVIGALVIFVIGWAGANWLSRRVQKIFQRTEKVDSTLTPIFSQSVRILVLAITILAVLSKFGVETASLIAVLGTIGLAIGLALQGTLSNIASGIMLLILRPIRVGDTVDVGGTQAIVDEIGLFVTYMHTFDNVAVIMPNSKVWGDKIENYTANPTRRVDMEFGIHYDDDIDHAMRIIDEILQADERILEEPEPLIAVGMLADSSVNIRVRPWVKTEDLWPVRYDIQKKVKERFDEEGITIPFPQRDIHMSSPESDQL